MTGKGPEPAAALADWEFLRRPATRAILGALGGAEGTTRIVGGAVRDALMGRPVSDADLATALTPAEVLRRATAAGFKTAPTGISHGTVTVIVGGAGQGGQAFEVTTLRRDVETDGRHAVVSFTTDWAEDAGRRDFTMNALYCDAAGAVSDPLGGLPDIAERRVRFIGDPEDRIREDYLRILRFFRFFAWFGVGRPDADGLRAVARLKGGLSTLSAERVWSELKRLFAAPDPSRALLWMRTTEVLHKVLPESWGIDAIHRLIDAEKAEGWVADPLLRLEAVLPPHRARIDGLAARLKLSRAEHERLIAWAEAPEADPDFADAELDALLYRAGAKGVLDRLKHAFAREREAGHSRAAARLLAFAERAGEWTRPVLPVSGRDLVALGMSPGPELGSALAVIEDAWVESGFTLERDELIAGFASQPDP